MTRRKTATTLLVSCLAPAVACAADWPQFGFDPQHSANNSQEAAIRRANVATLHLLYSVQLPDIADGAPAFLSHAATPQGRKDLLFLTTKDGRILALDAATGTTVWSRRPATGPNYTTSSPAIDPNRQFVYSYALEGRVHKYRVGDGVEITTGGWPQRATLKPQVEKGSSALAIATARDGKSRLYCANGGYPGDAGDYQGHVTTVDLATGQQRIFNANCSDQTVHFNEDSAPDCPEVQTAVWARPGVIYDPDTDRIYFATGNGTFDGNHGGHDWGDSVLAIRPDGTGSGGRPLDSYTPAEFQFLEDVDADLGSTAPAILPPPAGSQIAHLGVQSGKDGKLRLLNLDDLSGGGGPGRVGGELQKIDVPQGGGVLTQPAVWINPADGGVWTFVANGSGISGLQVIAPGGAPRLTPRWNDGAGGTSPIVANDILYYSTFGAVRAVDPTTGGELWTDPGPTGLHWESPIVVNGRLYVTDEAAVLRVYGPSEPPCVAGATTLCLNDGRFRIQAMWRTGTGASGSGMAVPLTSDTGYFWFFNAANVEMVVKVLDGCPVNQSFWLFAAGLTNVEVTLTATDTVTAEQRQYTNLQGTPFAPIQDTSAFFGCP